jgi:hypothetical protein
LDDPTDAAATDFAFNDTWLVNRAREPVVIRADAGAGSVLVDTLARDDSTRVRLQSRADSILLSATDLSGSARGRHWIGPRGSVGRVEFP